MPQESPVVRADSDWLFSRRLVNEGAELQRLPQFCIGPAIRSAPAVLNCGPARTAVNLPVGYISAFVTGSRSFTALD